MLGPVKSEGSSSLRGGVPRPLYPRLAVIPLAKRGRDYVEERQVCGVVALLVCERYLVFPWCMVPALVVVVNVIVGLLVRRVSQLFPAAAAIHSPTWCFRDHLAEGLAGAARAGHRGGHSGWGADGRVDGGMNVKLMESRVTFHSHVPRNTHETLMVAVITKH